MFIVTGKLYFDHDYMSVVKLPVGPFSTKEKADAWVESISPVQGSWSVEELQLPQLEDLRISTGRIRQAQAKKQSNYKK